MKRVLRKLKSVCWTALSLSVILLAALIGAVHLALPHVEGLKPAIEAQLSASLHREVRVARLSGAWVDGRPVINLRGMTLGRTARASAFEVPHAELTVDALAWLRGGQPRVFELSILNQELKIVRQRDGRVVLAGIGLNNDPMSQNFVLDEGALNLKGLSLRILDEASGRSIALSGLDLRATRLGERVTLGGSWQQKADGARAELIADLDASGGALNGRIYVLAQRIDLRALDLGTLAPQLLGGRVSGQLWAQVHDGEISSVQMTPEFSDLRLRISASEAPRAPPQTIEIGALAFSAYLARTRDTVEITLSGLSDTRTRPNAGFVHARIDQREPGTQRLEVTARGFAVEHLRSALLLTDFLSASARELLISTDPHGWVDSLRLRAELGSQTQFIAELDLLKASWQPFKQWPGAERLDVRLRGSEREGALQISTTKGSLSWPHLFNETFALSELNLPLSYSRSDSGLNLSAETLALNTQDLRLAGRVALDFPSAGGRPFADIQLKIDDLEIKNARRYWPKRGMAPRSIKWLNEGLLAGSLNDGEILLHGDLNDWPFRGKRGRFEASAVVSQATLKFNPAWPHYENFSADLTFVDQSLQIHASGGSVLGNPMERAVARIDDYRDAILDLEFAGANDALGLSELIRQSPIHTQTGRIFDTLTALGPARAEGAFKLSLKPGVKDLKLDGRVTLDGVDFAQPQWTLNLSDARGVLNFTEDGLSGDGIELTDRDIPMSIALRSGRATGVANQPFSARGRLHASIQQLLRVRPQSAESLLDRVSGLADFDLELLVNKQADGRLQTTLALDSDLTGITLDLPVPMKKSPFEARRLRFSSALPLGVNGLNLSLAGLGRAELLYDKSRITGLDLALDSSISPHATPGAFSARGALDQLDLSEWLELSQPRAKSQPALEFGPFDLSVKRLNFLNRTFADTAFKLNSSAASYTIDVASLSAEGRIVVPRSADLRVPIQAKFKRLNWPEGRVNPSPAAPTNPTELRALQLTADNVQFQRARLGRVALTTEPQPNGLKVRQFLSTTGDTQISARGTWTQSGAQVLSNFQIDVTASSLDAMLRNFDYAGRVEAAPLTAKFDVSWDGAPADFALERLSGLLSAKVGAGRLLKVEPGPGRIFGLLSLEAIPRRLTLDFSDMFQKGLTFDHITGDFQLSAGQAYTQGLTISGPSVDITIKGRTGLMARDYSQDMVVSPKLGNTLPIVGALAGGPVGAAAAFVVSGILSKPLSQIARYRYTVTGPWNNPKVVPMTPAPRVEG